MDDDSRMLSQDRDFKLVMRLLFETWIWHATAYNRYLRACYGFVLKLRRESVLPFQNIVDTVECLSEGDDKNILSCYCLGKLMVFFMVDP